MTTENIVSELRKLAESNKVAEVVFHVFALRDRTRSVLTVGGLRQRMAKNGFFYADKEYVKLFEQLAKLELGTLMLGSKGKIVGLKNIKIKLQSIGEVACNKGEALESFNERTKYNRFNIPAAPNVPKVVNKPFKQHGLTLILELNGAKVQLTIPENTSKDSVAELVKRLM